MHALEIWGCPLQLARLPGLPEPASHGVLQVRQSAGLLLKNNLKPGSPPITAEQGAYIKVGRGGCAGPPVRSYQQARDTRSCCALQVLAALLASELFSKCTVVSAMMHPSADEALSTPGPRAFAMPRG